MEHPNIRCFAVEASEHHRSWRLGLFANVQPLLEWAIRLKKATRSLHNSLRSLLKNFGSAKISHFSVLRLYPEAFLSWQFQFHLVLCGRLYHPKGATLCDLWACLDLLKNLMYLWFDLGNLPKKIRTWIVSAILRAINCLKDWCDISCPSSRGSAFIGCASASCRATIGCKATGARPGATGARPGAASGSKGGQAGPVPIPKRAWRAVVATSFPGCKP